MKHRFLDLVYNAVDRMVIDGKIDLYDFVVDYEGKEPYEYLPEDIPFEDRIAEDWTEILFCFLNNENYKARAAYLAIQFSEADYPENVVNSLVALANF